MAKKHARNRSESRGLATTARTTQLDVIKVGTRDVPVTDTIATLETRARKVMEDAGAEMMRHGLRLIELARLVMPLFAEWCTLLAVTPRGSADLFLTRVDPNYNPKDNRTPGSHSMSMANRWRNLQSAWALDQARTKLETIAALPPGDARDAQIEALENTDRKAIAKLDLSESPDLAETRAEFIATATDDEADNATTRLSATDIRNALCATVLALTPVDQRTQLTEELVKRMSLSEGAAKTFRVTGIAVKPWITARTPADGIKVLPLAPKADTTADQSAETTTGRGARKRAA